MARFLGWLGLAGLVAVLDQLSKAAILQHFRYGETQTVTSFFDLVLVYNPGAAFSFLADHSGWQRWFFVILAIVICAWLVSLLWQHRKEFIQPVAFALIIGGALGNVVDRLRLGAVVDFLFFHWKQYGWPAFNLADSAICLGVALMVIAQLRDSRANKAHGEPSR